MNSSMKFSKCELEKNIQEYNWEGSQKTILIAQDTNLPVHKLDYG